jgi:hypothetical protein
MEQADNLPQIVKMIFGTREEANRFRVSASEEREMCLVFSKLSLTLHESLILRSNHSHVFNLMVHI